MELAPAWEMLDQEDPQGAMIFAAPYLDASKSEVRDEAAKVIGLALFAVGDYDGATRHFAQVVDHLGEPADWFNLATAATMAGEIVTGEDAMREAVDRAKAIGSGADPSIPFMRLYYAHALADVEEYERALDQLNTLRQTYRWFASTDPDYLESRGIPPLEGLVVPVMKVFAGLGDRFDAVGWLEELAATLDDRGRELIADVMGQLAK